MSFFIENVFRLSGLTQYFFQRARGETVFKQIDFIAYICSIFNKKNISFNNFESASFHLLGLFNKTVVSCFSTFVCLTKIDNTVLIRFLVKYNILLSFASFVIGSIKLEQTTSL